MTTNSRLLRALQIISDTSRKINPAIHPTTKFPTILKSLPEHKPLLPLLLSHNIPCNLAKECADRYDKCAKKLRSETEAKLAPYLVNRRRNKPARVYSLFLGNYNQALRDWAQSILDIALRGLQRDPVELGDWDVAHPAPLWLPHPPDSYPAFACNSTQAPCPLSAPHAPTHAFPTTYPPPLRPTSKLTPVEYQRTPVTPTNASTSTIDLDTLCVLFAELLIDEDMPQPPKQRPSIFSLPTALKAGDDSSHFHTKPPKRKASRARDPQDSRIPKSIINPLKPDAPRRRSAPPSTSFFPKTRPTPCKASAPLRASAPQRVRASPRPSDCTRRIVPTTPPSPLNTPTISGSDNYFSGDLSTPLPYPQSPLGSTLNRIAYTPQSLSCFPVGPSTPPTLLSHLFSEPIVVPSTPIRLSPETSTMPIAGPFLQYQPQYDYFSDPALVPSFEYGGTTPGLSTDSFFSKSTFDTPLGLDRLYHGIPSPTISDPSDPFNAYIIS